MSQSAAASTARLEPLLPKGIKSGRPPKWSKRQLIDGIRWRTRTGAPWRGEVRPMLQHYGASGAERVRVKEMEDEIRRLRMENEFLKKAAAFFARKQP